MITELAGGEEIILSWGSSFEMGLIMAASPTEGLYAVKVGRRRQPQALTYTGKAWTLKLTGKVGRVVPCYVQRPTVCDCGACPK